MRKEILNVFLKMYIQSLDLRTQGKQRIINWALNLSFKSRL